MLFLKFSSQVLQELFFYSCVLVFHHETLEYLSIVISVPKLECLQVSDHLGGLIFRVYISAKIYKLGPVFGNILKEIFLFGVELELFFVAHSHVLIDDIWKLFFLWVVFRFGVHDLAPIRLLSLLFDSFNRQNFNGFILNYYPSNITHINGSVQSQQAHHQSLLQRRGSFRERPGLLHPAP